MLRVIKAAQRLGFTLTEVAELLEIGAHRHPPTRRSRSLQDRAAVKLAEVEHKIADLQVVADTLRAAHAADCDDLIHCASNPDCPLPFTQLGADGPASRR